MFEQLATANPYEDPDNRRGFIVGVLVGAAYADTALSRSEVLAKLSAITKEDHAAPPRDSN